jgi:hypothetical protein
MAEFAPKTAKERRDYAAFLIEEFDPDWGEWPWNAFKRRKPRKPRKPSITTLIKRARKAGERGPVTVTLPDGTTIISEREGVEVTATTNPWDKVLTNATH